MKFRDLEPEFMRITSPTTRRSVGSLAEAQGVMFLCPACFQKNGGAVGTHMVLVWFKGRDVPADAEPLPGRWDVVGTGMDDLTLSPSIHLTPSPCKNGGAHQWNNEAIDGSQRCLKCEELRTCEWHGWVQRGDAT